MGACWEIRGCDDEMLGRCPHNVPGEPCPVECRFAECDRPNHVVCDDLDLLLNPKLDYDAAMKQVCRFCAYFLANGPDMSSRSADSFQRNRPSRFLL